MSNIEVRRGRDSCELIGYCLNFSVLGLLFKMLTLEFFTLFFYRFLTQNLHPIVLNCLLGIWQSHFHYPLIVLISISCSRNKTLCALFLFSVISYLFHFVFFFINDIWWWYWIHVLSFELEFSVSCQQVFIKHVMNCSSF